MREIKFRGIVTVVPEDLQDTYKIGQFHYGGFYLKCGDTPTINDGHVALTVDPATVGQFTGMKDKNDKDVYEGDLIVHTSFVNQPAKVEFLNGSYIAKYKNNTMPVTSYHESVLEVIGTVHTHPELIK